MRKRGSDGMLKEKQKLPIGDSLPVWRLVNTGSSSGARNMAIDEAVMLSYADKKVPPTIRFYGWEPAAVSIGYFQQAAKEIDYAFCREQGIDVVRRLTGGRAVLHAAELTYSIVVAEDYPGMPPTITASYRYLTQGLLLGLAKIGLTAEMTKPQSSYAQRVPGHPAQHSSAACFDAPSHYELTVGGKKLIGSAQVRKKGVILQHGSILLDFSPELLAGVLNAASERKKALSQMLERRATSLRTALGRTLTYDEAYTAMAEGFAAALPAELQKSQLTEEEQALAGALCREKYGRQEWTRKK